MGQLNEQPSTKQQNQEGHLDAPVLQPPTIPVLQWQQKGGFHINQDNLSLPKGHFWDSPK